MPRIQYRHRSWRRRLLADDGAWIADLLPAVAIYLLAVIFRIGFYVTMTPGAGRAFGNVWFQQDLPAIPLYGSFVFGFLLLGYWCLMRLWVAWIWGPSLRRRSKAIAAYHLVACLLLADFTQAQTHIEISQSHWNITAKHS